MFYWEMGKQSGEKRSSWCHKGRKRNVDEEKSRQRSRSIFCVRGWWEGAWGCSFWRNQKPLAVGNQSRLEGRKRGSYNVYLRRVKLLSSVIRRKSSLEMNGTGKAYKAFVPTAPREIWQIIYTLTVWLRYSSFQNHRSPSLQNQLICFLHSVN